jgi:Fe-S cluster assembly ATP-binding protein
MPIDERARLGIGISYQRPPSIQGLKTRQMVQICSKGNADIDALANEMNFSEFLDRDINVGFSGGELKRSELLQLMAQDPDLLLFDEPESGVDLENISLIGKTISDLLMRNHMEAFEDKTVKQIKKERPRIGLIITHTGFILDYISADRGHVLYKGMLACKGNPVEIFKQIKEVGYRECVRCAS